MTETENGFYKILLRVKSIVRRYMCLLRKHFLQKTEKGDSIRGVQTLAYVMNLGEKYLDAGSSITIVVIGLDNFKQYNDCFGHLLANNILVGFEKKLIEKTIDFNSVVGKLGGDEFVVLLKNGPEGNLSNIESISNRIKKLMEDELYSIDSNVELFKVPFSIGEATASKESISSIDKLLNKAEANMFYNKYTKRSSVRDEIPHMNTFQDQSSQLLKVLAEKDMYTYLHSQYVAKYSVSIAEALNLSDDFIRDIYFAGWLHDIGKITISNDILRKPSMLSDDELLIMKKHVINGLNIINDYDFTDTVKNAVLYHQERWDGRGYPNGIMGKNTPIEGRILQVADAFSAMIVKRVYRQQLSLEGALDEIQKHSGSQFDPEIVSVFAEILKKEKLAI